VIPQDAAGAVVHALDVDRGARGDDQVDRVVVVGVVALEEIPEVTSCWRLGRGQPPLMVGRGLRGAGGNRGGIVDKTMLLAPVDAKLVGVWVAVGIRPLGGGGIRPRLRAHLGVVDSPGAADSIRCRCSRQSMRSHSGSGLPYGSGPSAGVGSGSASMGEAKGKNSSRSCAARLVRSSAVCGAISPGS